MKSQSVVCTFIIIYLNFFLIQDRKSTLEQLCQQVQNGLQQVGFVSNPKNHPNDLSNELTK